MVSSGRYASMSEVMRAGIRALDREERALDAWVGQRLHAEAETPSRMMPADEVFDRLRAEGRQRHDRDAA